MTRHVYLDNAATTPVAPEVIEEMIPYFGDSFGNPSSIYSFARKNRDAIELARQKVANAINASPEEIYFTSGGTEADNWAIKGAAFRKDKRGGHIISTVIEHHAVLHTVEFLEKMGYRVTFLPVDRKGRVSPEEVEKTIEDDTFIVSIMYANNEIGTIQPVEEIGEICRKRGVFFHTDAVQAAGHIPVDVKSIQADMISLSGHKFRGPKGVGVLFVRRGVKIENLIHGGGQEKGRRATTENVPGIVGFGKAIELALGRMEKESARQAALRDRLIRELSEKIPHSVLNGAEGEKRLPNNVNMSFVGVEGETLLLDLDAAGISASTGSACSSGSLDPSHVLMAIGLDHAHAHGSLRMTVGDSTTDKDIDHVIRTLPEIISRRREMSPLWEDLISHQ